MKKRIAQLFGVLIMILLLTGCSTFKEGFEEGLNDDTVLTRYEEGFHFSTKNLVGDKVEEDVLDGYKMVLINIWEPWWEPSVSELKVLERISNEYKDKGLLVIGVTNKRQEGGYFAYDTVKENGVTYLQLMYCDDFDKYDNDGHVPTSFLLDENREIIPLTEEELLKIATYYIDKDIEAYENGEFEQYRDKEEYKDDFERLEKLKNDAAFRDENIEYYKDMIKSPKGSFSCALTYEQWKEVLDARLE